MDVEDKQKDDDTPIPEDVTDGDDPTLVDDSGDRIKPSSPGKNLKEEVGVSPSASDSNGEVVNIQSEMQANDSSELESGVVPSIIEGVSENHTGTPAAPQDDNVESVDTEQDETVDTEQVETVDTEQVETVDTKQVESVDTAPFETVDTEQVARVDTAPVENVDTEQVENVDTAPVESVDTEQVETVDTEQVENVDNAQVENVDTEQVESVDTEQADSVDTEQVETVDTEQVETVDTEQADSVDTEQVENVDTEQVESVDAAQVESVDTEQVENVDTAPVESEDTIQASGTETAPSEDTQEDTEIKHIPENEDVADDVSETAVETPGDSETVSEFVAMDIPEEVKEAENVDNLAVKEQDAVEVNDILIDDPQSIENLDNEDEPSMDQEAGMMVDQLDSGDVGKADTIAAEDDIDEDELLQTQKDTEGDQSDDIAQFESSAAKDEDILEHMDTEEAEADCSHGYIKNVDDERMDMETADVSEAAIDQDESEITETAADETEVDDKCESELTDTAGETEGLAKDESDITETVGEAKVAIEKDQTVGNGDSTTPDDLEPIEANQETNIELNDEESPAELEQAETVDDEGLLDTDVAAEIENADLSTVDKPLSNMAEEADVSTGLDSPVSHEIDQTEEPASVAEAGSVEADKPESIVEGEQETNDEVESESNDIIETEASMAEELLSDALEEPESKDTVEPELNEVDAADVLSVANSVDGIEKGEGDQPAAEAIEAEVTEVMDVEPVQIDSDVEMVEETTADSQDGEASKEVPASGDSDPSNLAESQPAAETPVVISDISSNSVSNAVGKETTPGASIDLTDEDIKPVISDMKDSEMSGEKNDKPVETAPLAEVTVKVEDEKDNTSDIKIVGVTSASAKVEEETPVSGELDLKISSVSGAVVSNDVSASMKNHVSEPVQSIDVKSGEAKTVTKDEVKVLEKSQESAAPKKEIVQNEMKKVKAEEDDDVIAIKEEKKPPKPKPSSKIQTCIVCAKVGKCKYNIVRNGDVKHLCDDACFKRFRSSPTTFLRQAEKGPIRNGTQANSAASMPQPKAPPVKVPNAQPSKLAMPQPAGGPVYKTCNVCQLMNVRTSKPFLNWQGMDFCGEECLGKFQGSLSVTCSYCSSQIHQANKAKFCWRVADDDVKHFCSQTCNNEFVKRLKVCTFCNKDLAVVGDSFMAPVGNQGLFKDFCSQSCLQKFEEKNNKDLEIVGVQKGQKSMTAPKGSFYCAVCGKVGPVKHEFRLDGKVNRLCSDPCYSAFQYANKLTMNTCDNCGTSCYNEGQAPQYIQYEGQQKRFCSFMCVNTFRTANKKTMPCAWCSAKKNNFDMIERVDANNKYQLFCSLNCLSLYRVNLQATSNQAVTCDQCRKFVPAQYHLTMSDASVRNFCSYGCVMQFQAQFQAPAKGQAATQNKQVVSTPATPATQQTTRSGRMVTRGVTASKSTPPPPLKTLPAPKHNTRGSKVNSGDSFPIISNVVSLAPQGTQQQINVKSSTGVIVTGQQQGIKTTTTTTGNQTVQQQIIIQPPPPKSVKNKSLICKPLVQTKATSCRPHTQTKETQTEGKVEPDKYLVPVPVPVYCPTPLAMYSTPTPILIPVPVPIPIPIFIPTTKKSANSILKQIKEIQEKIPADPLEAELLMMAEAVSTAVKDSDSSSDSDDGDAADALSGPTMAGDASSGTPSKDVVPASGEGGDLGEDMLQMALRMASEMSEEPVMDLENSLEPVAVSRVPPPPPPAAPKSEPEDDEEYTPVSTRQTRRGRGANKRASRSTSRRTPKRQRVEVQPAFREATPSPPPPQAPPPDANFHLKYTYGVNAFKHWVMQKNAQLEQVAKPSGGKALKTFKSDVLQSTADELNFALCLFVKEVRKPNGEEYAVDSIFYLCLGIQQYLFENGRIDNIFTDIYCDRFTECLNELLTRYEPKMNHSGQLVCRIEEEHLWESKQLGAHSPHVLLNSLVYFNTKYFMLKTSEDHLKLSFTHIMKHWKKTANGRGSGTGANAGRSVYLRYYCPAPQQGKDGNAPKSKKKEDMPVYEQTENLDNPLRCPVKLYEFYLSKCPESIKNRNDTFYLVPERSCVPDSPVWYSTAMLGVDAMAKMLNRVRLVREIQEAHLHTQPIYI